MKNLSSKLRVSALFALPLSLVITFAGCSSPNVPYSASFAHVTINNRPPEQVRDATIAAFQESGYTVSAVGVNDAVFEREGSKLDKEAYGDWVGGPPVMIKVTASVVPLSAASVRLQCNAYVVRDPGQGIFEDDVKLSNLHRGPYQRLLDKVADRLK